MDGRLHYSAWYWRLAAHHMTPQTENRGFVWCLVLGTYHGKIRQHIAPLLLFDV
jgi:hypothetical protein